MIRIIGWVILAFILTIILVTPVRNFMNDLFYKDTSNLKEEEILGIVSGYNPRVKEVQKILKDAGFNPGPIDGKMGAKTTGAIKEFQKAKGLAPTGKIDLTTQSALNREKEMPKQISKAELKTGLLLGQTNQIEYEIGNLKESSEDIKKKNEVQDEVLSFRLKSKSRVRQIQTALKEAGFYNGPIDGIIGPQTTRAIRAFQKSKGLNSDGIVGHRTWEELSKY